ncbi:hypothetical protein HPB49_006287 [Dermacentor silvarum]|uniref:Uncharacterized protein n=1 Tax=Dermacentor silvarum TaxID=543639 RepID=A0ACB8CQ65_DERSI|nr:hypothetical protein HPB49_006287 [Dermacentor silvarum]
MAHKNTDTVIWQWNCRGYHHKQPVLRQHLRTSSREPDVLILQETHETPITLPGYQPFIAANAPHGVSTLVRHRITAIEHDLHDRRTEHLFIELIPHKKRTDGIFILNIYNAPSLRHSRFLALFKKALNAAGSSPLVIGGDFNLLHTVSGEWALAESEKVEQDYTVVTLADIQRLGEAKLDDAARSYIASGADQEQTLRENTAAFTRLRFRPKALVDVSKINTATTVLGRRISFPVGFSPSAAHMIADRVGELGTARAARDAGTLMIVSAMSTTSLEDIRASAPDCLLWQQTYIFTNRSLTKSLVRRAEQQGFCRHCCHCGLACRWTGRKPQQQQVCPSGRPQHMLLSIAAQGFTKHRFANLEASWPGRSFTFDPSSKDFIGNLLSPSATWEDFRWLRSISTLPIVVKGILTAEAALTAYQNGASAILVSNHGARQLDGDPATIEALPEVVAAVGDRMEIYLDGGVRTGADAVKALSIGARAVFVGRPGKEGVDQVLDILRSEFNRTIQLLALAAFLESGGSSGQAMMCSSATATCHRDYDVLANRHY